MAKKLAVVLTLDDKQFQSGLRKASKSLKNFGKSMKRTGQTLSTNLTLPIAGLALASVKMAADMEESLNKTRVAFGESSSEVEAFAKTTLTSFGIAESSALEMSSLFGDMATSMGINQTQAAQMSTTLVGLAGDLASFKNIGIEQAETALAGIFTGETESLKKLGIVITEANLKQFGFNKNMSQAEKIAVRYKAVMAASENAIGDYSRTSGGLTNSTRTLTETIKELGADLGEILIPIAQKVVNELQGMADRFRGLTTEQKTFILQIAGLAAALGPLLIVLGQTASSLGSIGKALIFISANPMVALLTAITTLTALLGYAILDMEGFIKTALNLGKVGRMVAKAVIMFADATGLMSKVEATAAIATIDGMSKKSKDLEDSLDDTTNSVDDQKTAIDGLIKSLDDMSAAQQKASRDSKKVREIASISPIAAGPVQATEGQTSAAPQFAVMGLDSEWFASMEQGLVAFDNLDQKVQDTANAFSDAFMSMSSDADLSFAGIMKAAANAARQIIKIEISKAVASYAAQVFATVPFPANLALAASAGLVVGALFEKVVPKFADGGIISGPTIGMVGEYAGARTNPEVIAPLDKLQGMLGDSGKVMVEGVIRGEDIFLSSERYNRRLSNF